MLFLTCALAATTGAGCGGSSAAPGDGGPHADAAPPLPMPAWDWAGVIGTGQSLAVGVMGTPPTATGEPAGYDNLKLFLGSLTGPPLDPTASTLKVVQLDEPLRAFSTLYPEAYPLNIDGETPHTAMADQITSLYLAAGGVDYVTAHTEVGESGQGYVEIEKGATYTTNNGATGTGTAGLAYAASLFEAQVFTNLAMAAGKTYGVGAIIITHGEVDAGNTGYEADLVQLWTDYNADLPPITSQTTPIPMLVSQQHSSPSGVGTTSASTLAQWMVGVDHPGDIICSGPKYQYPYASDFTHLTAEGYDMLGEKYGQVYYQKAVLGQDWQPLQPISLSVSGAVLTLKFHVPVPPLVMDADSVVPPPQQAVPEWMNGHGFEVNSAGAPATIQSVQIVGDDTVQITLDDAPSSLNSAVGYAFTANAAAMPGGTVRWGQLHDSDPFVGSTTGLPQTNHCVAFQMPIQ
jgi:hypothetical protein